MPIGFTGFRGNSLPYATQGFSFPSCAWTHKHVIPERSGWDADGSPTLQAARCCGMCQPPANPPLQLLPPSPHSSLSSWGTRTKVLLERSPRKHHRGSGFFFFTKFVKKKTKPKQTHPLPLPPPCSPTPVLSYYNPQSLYSYDPDNQVSWLGAWQLPGEATLSPLPDVAQGQVYEETCLNLTVPWPSGEGHPKDAAEHHNKSYFISICWVMFGSLKVVYNAFVQF